MTPLFQPPDLDRLASRADTKPYIQNICQHLSFKNANLYHNFIKFFEEDVISEETLASMVRDSRIFSDQPYISLLHDDLVIVIIMNRLDTASTTHKEINDNIASADQAVEVENISPSTISGKVKGRKVNAALKDVEGNATNRISQYQDEIDQPPQSEVSKPDTTPITTPAEQTRIIST